MTAPFPPPPASSVPQPSGGRILHGSKVWLLTVATCALLLVVGGASAAVGATAGVVVLGVLAVLWSVFGIGTLAGRAMSAGEGPGQALVSVLVSLLVVPALAAGLFAVAAAQEVASSFDDPGFLEGDDAEYDECLADPDTTLEDCEELLGG